MRWKISNLPTPNRLVSTQNLKKERKKKSFERLIHILFCGIVGRNYVTVIYHISNWQEFEIPNSIHTQFSLYNGKIDKDYFEAGFVLEDVRLAFHNFVPHIATNTLHRLA